MYIRLSLLIIVVASCMRGYCESKVLVLRMYEFSDAQSICSVSNLRRQGLQLDKMTVVAFEKGASQKKEIRIPFEGVRVCVDEYEPVYYAKQVGDRFELVKSTREQGVMCDLELEGFGDSGYLLKGVIKCTAVARRDVFKPFPKLNAGFPRRMYGGTNIGNIAVQHKKATLCSYVEESQKGSIKRITALVVTVEEKGAEEGKKRGQEKG